MILKHFFRIIFLLFMFSFIKTFSYASSGGFLVQKNVSSKNKHYENIKNKKHNLKQRPSYYEGLQHANTTPYTMKELYLTDLYKSFYDVLKIKGFNEYDIPRLFCIAKLESSFNPKAKNLNTNGSIDAGLFQINSIWKKTCKSSLYSVESNIDCAKIVVEKQGLNAWVTYKKYGGICEKS